MISTPIMFDINATEHYLLVCQIYWVAIEQVSQQEQSYIDMQCTGAYLLLSIMVVCYSTDAFS